MLLKKSITWEGDNDWDDVDVEDDVDLMPDDPYPATTY